MSLFEPIFLALNDAGARYVVVGGLATVLHGYARLTVDVDLVVDLAPDRARTTIDTLVTLGFRARVPVDARDFADPAVRRRWIDEKGMQVFSLVDQDNPMRVIDLFVEAPLDFEALWSRAEIMPLAGTTVRVASLDDLIAMKRQAGRPRDLDDIAQLERIRDRRDDQT